MDATLTTAEKTMSSREIAELTGKRHDHVLRDCENLNANYEKLALPKIGLSEFQLKEKWIDRNEHEGFVVVKVLVTQRGLAFLSMLFKATPAPKRLAPVK